MLSIFATLYTYTYGCVYIHYIWIAPYISIYVRVDRIWVYGRRSIGPRQPNVAVLGRVAVLYVESAFNFKLSGAAPKRTFPLTPRSVLLNSSLTSPPSGPLRHSLKMTASLSISSGVGRVRRSGRSPSGLFVQRIDCVSLTRFSGPRHRSSDRSRGRSRARPD